jgi:hypothetical protein
MSAQHPPSHQRIPIFPLGSVLYPGGTLALQIFEPRYVDMVSERLKRDAPFGVCLIREGGETGPAAVPHDVGTLAHIADWERLPNGLLGLSARGGARFRIETREVQPNQLTVADVAALPDDPPRPVPARHAGLLEVLAALRRRLGLPFPDPDDPGGGAEAGWVAYRLAELLPLPLSMRQELLEVDDPEARLDRLAAAVETLIRRSGE